MPPNRRLVRLEDAALPGPQPLRDSPTFTEPIDDATESSAKRAQAGPGTKT